MITMPRRTATTVVVALLLTLLFAAGCGQVPRDSGDSGELEIRTYTVPEGVDAARLRTDLNASLMSSTEHALGTVVDRPDGSLVVTAPANVQVGIEALIEHMKTAGAGTMLAPETVAIDYWIVVGRPVEQPVGAKAGPHVGGENLSQLAPALEQIQAAQGPMTFRLLEKMRLSSVGSGDTSRMSGRFARVEQRVSNLGSASLLADIQIGVPGYDIETRIKLEPGKLIVLGETGLLGTKFPELQAKDDEGLMLYYVISADID